MIESAAYELIRQDAFKDGLRQRKVLSAQENQVDILAIRFGAPSRNVIRTIEGIGDLSLLQVLKSKAMMVPSLRAFIADMKKMLR